MPATSILESDLLEPISPEEPSGRSLRYEPEWDEIKEARRADDPADVGEYEKEGGAKISDWAQVVELCSTAFKEKTKDLQLAIWQTEALIHLHGFPGCRDSLRFIRELIDGFWDTLHPEIEDNDLSWRSSPLEWLNDKMAELIRQTPLTVRSDGGDDYSLYIYRDSRKVGSREKLKDARGKIDREKEKLYESALAEKRVSEEMFDEAVRASKRADYEALAEDIQQTQEELQALSTVLDEKFGQSAPPLSRSREALEECGSVVRRLLKVKRQQEPDITPQEESGEAGESEGAAPLRIPSWTAGGASDSGSWQHAEEMIRSGRTEEGLTEMMRLAAAETSGRARFQRKLFLAEICLSLQRERLARTILEELAEQVETYKLAEWETSDMVGRVWSRLYECYKSAEAGDESKAAELYEKLCRLDPWQAFACGD